MKPLPAVIAGATVNLASYCGVGAIALLHAVVADLAEQLGVLGEREAHACAGGVPIRHGPALAGAHVVPLVDQGHLGAEPLGGLNGQHIEDPQS